MIYGQSRSEPSRRAVLNRYGSIIFRPQKSGDDYAKKGLLVQEQPLIFLERYTIIKDQHQINENIRDREVRVISAEGEQLGIMSASAALRLAEDENLDLVKISPNAVPPVCKIMNYGKFKFEQAKREKENRRNQKIVELKEIYLSMTIDVGDLNVKAKKTMEMLGDGNKVKVSIRMRGRQQAHASMGIDVMRRFFDMLGGKAVMDKEPKTEGRNILMILSPAK
ncbi:MAG: translation initiation factor IF-3 [Clostridia bacterium]|nr:translation initiation factor IF-3 [Clostridia bacterium]